MYKITILVGVQLILAIILFGCIFELPYGYYQLVRFIAVIGFLFLAYKANTNQEKYQVIIYVVLAMLFQPFFKVYLGRALWIVVDLIVGIGLIISIFITLIKLRGNVK